MGRRKSVFESGSVPVFKYYRNRKTYFANSSVYVTHEEIRKIISDADGKFVLQGDITEEKFLLKILTEVTAPDMSDVLIRVIKSGGFLNYISKLEEPLYGVRNKVLTSESVEEPNFNM